MVDVTLAKVLCLFFIQCYSSCVLLSYWLRGLFNASCRTLPMPGIVCVCVGCLAKFLFARCCAFLFTSAAVASERTRVACCRHVGEDVVCTEFLICACKCATYFCRLINNYAVAVMRRTSRFQSLTVYELFIVIHCFVGSIRRCWHCCSQEVLVCYSEVCPS